MMRNDFRLRRFFFSQSTQGSKARKGISLRENGLRPLLRLQHEDGIEACPFPPSAFRLPTWHPSRFARLFSA
jgi:hypothetical protein